MDSNTVKQGRAEATRAEILEAARERFAADGYERATIRAIAADADVDPALVMRYFGSKEGLFAAAAEFDLRLPDFSSVSKRRMGRTLVEHFLTRWEDDEILKALLRSAATNERAAERVREIFAGQVLPAVKKLTGGAKDAPTRAGLITSQIMGFALCRYVLRLPPIVAMHREQVVEALGPTVQRYLTEPRER